MEEVPLLNKSLTEVEDVPTNKYSRVVAGVAVASLAVLGLVKSGAANNVFATTELSSTVTLQFYSREYTSESSKFD